MKEPSVGKGIRINGIVQGVGFRPFVYQTARKHHITGTVANTSSGVLIHAEGTPENIRAFEQNLTETPPPLAHITDVRSHSEPVRGDDIFAIIGSSGGETAATLISPDVSVCADCLREMFDPGDRRYGYPFINCTNCGPRYTIINDIPYDRPKTSMEVFRMCPACQAEYDSPEDRRFHAQPNACPVCGPSVTLCDRSGRPLETGDPVRETARLLKAGHVVAVKGLGGFHLAANAENADTVRRLRERKRREEKPFALMSPDLAHIRRYAEVTDEEAELLNTFQRPIVLLKKREPSAIAGPVAPGNRYFGVMLPCTPLHYLLLQSEEGPFTALVMTSANLSEEPIVIDNAEAFRRLGDIADYFLIHNREIYLRSDDSIVRRVSGAVRSIRRSRGYAPMPVFLRSEMPPVLGCGAELKSTICLTKGRNAFLSQHIGDLENLDTYNFFRMTVEHLKRILAITPEIIAHDLHPDYLSTRYALEQEGVQKVPVQHHHAHIASVVAENGLHGPVIGLAFDGTGYGSDGAIWGGEVLTVEGKTCHRAAHLQYMPMPGGAAAIKEPWRMAAAYLEEAFDDPPDDMDLPFLRTVEPEKLRIIRSMIRKRLNAPMTSSLGRLFDGVAALLDIRQRVTFEGQAAMELEMMADLDAEGLYPYEWRTIGENGREILLRPVLTGILSDLRNGVSTPVISGRFHRTLIHLFTDLCGTLKQETGLNRVALSGGVFQNAILLEGMIRSLTGNGFEVFTHTQVPANDGGIALGQVVIAGCH